MIPLKNRDGKTQMVLQLIYDEKIKVQVSGPHSPQNTIFNNSGG